MTESNALAVLAVLAQNLKPIDAWRLGWVSKAIPRPRGRFLYKRGQSLSWPLVHEVVDIAFWRWPTRIAIRCDKILAWGWRCPLNVPMGSSHVFCEHCRLYIDMLPVPWELLIHVDPADERETHTYVVGLPRQNEINCL